MNWFIEHFTQDFIENQRYMYLVNGLKNTLIITVFAALLGIALGFVLAIIRSSHDKSDKPGIILKILNFTVAGIAEISFIQPEKPKYPSAGQNFLRLFPKRRIQCMKFVLKRWRMICL